MTKAFLPTINFLARGEHISQRTRGTCIPFGSHQQSGSLLLILFFEVVDRRLNGRRKRLVRPITRTTSVIDKG